MRWDKWESGEVREVLFVGVFQEDISEDAAFC